MTYLFTDIPFSTRVALGKVAGWSGFRLIGFNDTTGDGTFDAIWPKDGEYVFPPSASTMQVYSTDASDTTQTLSITGLDSSYNIQTEIVTLNGQTGVTTTKSYLRVNNCVVLSGNPLGIISVGTGSATSGIPTNTYEYIPAGHNVSLKGVFTVPNGYRLASTNVLISVGGIPATQFIMLRLKIITSTGVRYIRNKITASNGDILFPLDPEIVFPSRTDFVFEADTSGGGTASVNVSVGGYLVQDGY